MYNIKLGHHLGNFKLPDTMLSAMDTTVEKKRCRPCSHEASGLVGEEYVKGAKPGEGHCEAPKQ